MKNLLFFLLKGVCLRQLQTTSAIGQPPTLILAHIVDNVSPGLVGLFSEGVSLSNTVILYMTIVG